MPRLANNSRNEEIFRKILAGAHKARLADEYRVSRERIDQIFKAEAERLYPKIYSSVAVNRGHGARLMQALKAGVQL